MAVSTKTNGSFTLKAYPGDNKTLLAFNITDKKSVKNLAGFTIQCTPPGASPYYLFNELQFEDPSKHAQVATEKSNSTVNAPIHKFRWVHVTGSFHQGTKPAVGAYAYTVTPRYFDGNGSLEPIDKKLSASVTVNVGPFKKAGLSLGFTRGYMQSEAFTHHFGPKAKIRPDGKDLIFDTSENAGVNPAGQKFTWTDEYEWMGASARVAIFDLLNAVLEDSSLRLDMFAYDLNEPDVCELLLKLAKQGRMRMILDNATLHHSTSDPKPEDEFTDDFEKAAKKSDSAIKRGKFGRFSHDKVMIVSKRDSTNPANAVRVLTGSTNFSVTGLYVNANHILIFDDPAVAEKYSEVFNESWNDNVSAKKFSASTLSTTPFEIKSSKTPQTTITFSPHTKDDVDTILGGITDRIAKEGKRGTKKPSVIFAVMQLTGSDSPVYSSLNALNKNDSVFSYGISDSPAGIKLFTPHSKQGVLVTGKTKATLPPPFDQVPTPPGHEIHNKFVVCGFNGDNPVVYCGSSNLATGGEAANGDNLIAIEDGDIATCFAIEAILLVDHYNFLDRYATPKGGGKTTPKLKKQPVSNRQAAISQGMFLSTDDGWTKSYFDSNDLHFVERELFS
jgi:hypothetical protein